MIECIILFLCILRSSTANLCFPDTFLFGTATSAIQIEGAWNVSGKGENIWDYFAHNTAKIEDSSNADVACDSYNKYVEDIAMLKDLGVHFYRLSISWARILPQGSINNVNKEGINYYLNVLKLLVENGIEPMVTLYHFELPQTLSELGGWTNPILVDYFGDYARLCYERFGPYVKWWLTINEPSTTCLLGYGAGMHAPGYARSGTGIYLCAYTHALAHARAYHIYQQEFKAKQGGKVSLAIASSFLQPRTIDEAETAIVAMDFELGLWAHPIYSGDWPEQVKNRSTFRDNLAGLGRKRLKLFSQDEIEYINGTYDFFGLNYYQSSLVHKGWNITDSPKSDNYLIDRGYLTTFKSNWIQSSGSSWLYNVPWGLRSLLNWIKTKYNAPDIFITENGWSDDGTYFNDTDRIQYLVGHFCNLQQAIQLDNITILGHAVWSLMDNWEWAGGYTAKFGLASVDFSQDSRPRTPKDSYYWYKSFVADKCLDIEICRSHLESDW